LLLAYIAEVDRNNIDSEVPPPRMITPPPDRPLQPNVQYNVKMNTRTRNSTSMILTRSLNSRKQVQRAQSDISSA
jgi:hypothetical protein